MSGFPKPDFFSPRLGAMVPATVAGVSGEDDRRDFDERSAR